MKHYKVLSADETRAEVSFPISGAAITFGCAGDQIPYPSNLFVASRSGFAPRAFFGQAKAAAARAIAQARHKVPAQATLL